MTADDKVLPALAQSSLPAEPRGLAAQLGEALTRASWKLRRASVKELAPLGLTFAQSRLLRILARADEPLRMGDIAARFEIAPRSATSMVDSLESAGLVGRSADPQDRRSVLVTLAPGGRALVERMSTLRRASANVLFERLSDAQQELLLDLLTLLNEPSGECDDAPLASATGDDAEDSTPAGARAAT
jgi:DNA-binding MarR family transcriptional regulator